MELSKALRSSVGELGGGNDVIFFFLLGPGILLGKISASYNGDLWIVILIGLYYCAALQ
jgi:hypothetical protein